MDKKVNPTDKDYSTKELIKEGDSKDFYDMVVDVLVLPSLDFKAAGWKIILSQEHEKSVSSITLPQNKRLDRDETNLLSNTLFPEDEDRPRVCVVGLFDRGKTHLLNKLAGMDLGSSRRITTKGISIKVPKIGQGNSFVLIDTAGTNVPIDHNSINDHMKELERIKPWEMKYIDATEEETNVTDTTDLQVITEETENGSGEEVPKLSEEQLDRIEQEKKLHFMTIESKARDKAIINKQATELFLQELIFHLADIVVVVVNELTFDDQLYCEVLARKSKEFAQSVNADRSSTIYVVHNFKDTVTEEQLNYLVQKYIIECYEGKMREEEILVDGMQGHQKVKYFQNKDNRMVHVWLARDDTEQHPSRAGALFNRLTYQFLLGRIKSAKKAHKETILRDICSYSRKVLKELNFFKLIESVDIYYDGKTLALKGRAAAIVNKKKVFMELKLAPDEVIMQGKSLTFVQSSDFSPSVDIIYKKECMIVSVDLPGFTTSKDTPKPGDTGNLISVPVIDGKTFELVIKGTRKLFYYNLVNGIPQDKVSNYGVQNVDGVQIQRRYGAFEKRISIKHAYNRSEKPKWVLMHGVLQVVIAALEEDSDDDRVKYI